MERVLIIGSNGAGKSTFAADLARRTGLPLFHIDRFYWRGNWDVTPREDFERQIRDIVQTSRWIIDGNNIRSLEQRLERADQVFWLEFSPVLCMARILKRELMYRNAVRPDLPDKCISKLSPGFLRDAWRFNRKNRARIQAALDRHPSVPVTKFTRPRHVREYSKGLE